MDRDAAARFVTDFLVGGVEQRGDLEAFLAEPGVIGERQAEIAGADDRDAQATIEAENVTQMAPEVPDVVADAAHAEFAEVREVLSNLGGVEGGTVRRAPARRSSGRPAAPRSLRQRR